MSSAPLSVRDIVDLGGGAEALAAKSRRWARGNPKRRKAVAKKTIYCWYDNGIPEWHWAFVRSATNVSVEQLHLANEACRGMSVAA